MVQQLKNTQISFKCTVTWEQLFFERFMQNFLLKSVYHNNMIYFILLFLLIMIISTFFLRDDDVQSKETNGLSGMNTANRLLDVEHDETV